VAEAVAAYWPATPLAIAVSLACLFEPMAAVVSLWVAEAPAVGAMNNTVPPATGSPLGLQTVTANGLVSFVD
jgi:hypothetical protein